MSKFNAGKASLFALTAAFAVAAFLLGRSLTTVLAVNQGATWTTNSSCGGVNINIYANKADVYLNGGPQGGGPGLDDGNYFVQVTEPDGTLLGKTLTASAVVSGGNFSQCYQLVDILYTVSSGFTTKGYDTTTNSGNEYKVWVSKDGTFPGGSTKTDNYKVLPTETPIVPGCTDETANNYNPNATQDNGSCTYDVLGCTDEKASNYDSEATKDDGSCVYREPTPTPTSTPNGDVCLNQDGIQTSVPEGQHLGADGTSCVNFSDPGVPTPPPAGQVLGTSTMAKTGTFDEALYLAIMGLGATISAIGSKKVFKKA